MGKRNDARWLQEAVKFEGSDDDYDDDATDFSPGVTDGAAGKPPTTPPPLSGPLHIANLLYEDFETLLSRDPTTRLSTKPQSKAPLTPSLQLKRPQGSALQGRRAQASSSSSAAASSSSFVEEEAAPMLAVRPGVFWQKKPEPPKIAPPPQQPPPMLRGRPAKPPPPVEEEPTEEQQRTAVGRAVQKPPPTLGGRPAKPTPPPAQVEAQQSVQKGKDSREQLRPKAPSAPLQTPQPILGAPAAEPTPPTAQLEPQQPVFAKKKEMRGQMRPPMPQEPQPTLVGRPAKPPPTPQAAVQQQVPKDQAVDQQRQLLADSTQQSPQAQRAVQIGAPPKQEPLPVVERPSRRELAKTGNTEASLSTSPKLSRPQTQKADEEQQPPPVSHPALLPALLRPAPPQPAAPEEEEAAAAKQASVLAKLEKRVMARKPRQVRESPTEMAAKRAAERETAEKKAAKPAVPSLQLISPPRRRENPSVADVTNPVSWGLMDIDKFAAENPDFTAHKPRDYFWGKGPSGQEVQEQESPPPPLADPPARPASRSNDRAVQRSLTVTEWLEEAVVQYAQHAMATQQQLTVVVTGANAGGIMVRSRNLRGFIPTNMLSQTSYSQVMARQAELKAEQGLPVDAPEEETRKVRAEALRSLQRSILTATIVNVVPSSRRIILSERPPKNLSDNPSQQQLEARHVEVLQQNLGEVVEGVIVDVRSFGCFLEFDVEAEGADKHKVYGMVHASEMSWEYCEDARSLVKSGQVVEAVLMGVDPSTGKVWLSMRQVLPDPLQETLDALLAQGPPADSSEDGGEDEDGDEAMQMPAPEDLSYPREEASMAFQEVVEVAEALVLLPGVDSVTPGPQVFTRAAARDLQVYLSSMPLADLAATISAEEPGSSSDEDDQGELEQSDSDADVALGVPTPSNIHDNVKEQSHNLPVLQSSDGVVDEQQPSPSAAVQQLTSVATDEKQWTTDAADEHLLTSNGADDQRLASDATVEYQPIPDDAEQERLISDAAEEASHAADANALGMVLDKDVFGASTLVVRKGQQLQELLVSGSISQEELRHEIEKIVSFLMSPEDV
ncbi:hypothetical protein ABBQ32_012331 [Trebouxia sp. C0010 RCD-2024]